MISEPQIISLAAAVAQLGERAASASSGGSAAGPAPSSDQIALGTALAVGATSLSDAAVLSFSSESGPATSGASIDGATLEAVTSGILRDIATAPGGAPYVDPGVARGMSALVAAVLTNGAAPPGMPGSLAALTSVLTALASAPAALTGALAAQLRAALADDPAGLGAALASLPQPPAEAATAFPAIALAPFDPLLSSVRSSPSNGRASQSGAGGAARSRDDAAIVPIPERDAHGRRYRDEARRRLAVLGTDPRRGFAPEAEVAYAAEERWGVTFVRSADARFDFDDAAGRHWNTFAPRAMQGCAPALRALSNEAGVLMLTAGVAAGDRTALVTFVTRAAPGAHPILVVDALAEQTWPE